MKNPPTIFVVDDDKSVRDALLQLLGAAGHACEGFTSADAFLQRERHQGVGCLLLDLQMPAISGLELQDRMARLDYPLPIIFLTAHADIPRSVQAVKRGAVNFLSKPVDDELLLEAINEALGRSRELQSGRQERAAIHDRIRLLSAREYEVMQRVIAGTMNKQIGVQLGISEKTVKAHRGQVMRKMEVASVADLVRACQKANVTPFT